MLILPIPRAVGRGVDGTGVLTQLAQLLMQLSCDFSGPMPYRFLDAGNAWPRPMRRRWVRAFRTMPPRGKAAAGLRAAWTWQP